MNTQTLCVHKEAMNYMWKAKTIHSLPGQSSTGAAGWV